MDTRHGSLRNRWSPRFGSGFGGHHYQVTPAAKKELALAEEWEYIPRMTKWQYVVRVAGYDQEDGYFAVTEHSQRVPLVEHIDLLGDMGYELTAITPPRVLPAMAGGGEIEELSLHESDYLLIFKRPIPG